MKKAGGFIITLAFVIAIAGLFSIIQEIFIKNNGAEINAKVVRVDADCDRYNRIDVVYEGKTYEVSIGRDQCRYATYKVGQTVVLLKYGNNDTLVWPEARPELVLFLFLGLITWLYYEYKSKYGKTKKLKSVSANAN